MEFSLIFKNIFSLLIFFFQDMILRKKIIKKIIKCVRDFGSRLKSDLLIIYIFFRSISLTGKKILLQLKGKIFCQLEKYTTLFCSIKKYFKKKVKKILFPFEFRFRRLSIILILNCRINSCCLCYVCVVVCMQY